MAYPFTEPKLLMKTAHTKIAKVHSAVQRDALERLLRIAEEQQETIEEMSKEIDSLQKIVKGE